MSHYVFTFNPHGDDSDYPGRDAAQLEVYPEYFPLQKQKAFDTARTVRPPNLTRAQKLCLVADMRVMVNKFHISKYAAAWHLCPSISSSLAARWFVGERLNTRNVGLAALPALVAHAQSWSLPLHQYRCKVVNCVREEQRTFPYCKDHLLQQGLLVKPSAGRGMGLFAHALRGTGECMGECACMHVLTCTRVQRG